MFKKIISFLLIFTLASFVFTINSYAKGNERIVPPKVVKVGHLGYASANEGFAKPFPTSASSFNTEYLGKVANLNNWELEFVPGSLDECLSRLESGGVDIVGPLQYSQERAEKFDYPDFEFGYDYTALYCAKDSREFYYNDFKNFDGMEVGLIESNINNELFDKFCNDNNFSVKKTFYPDVQTLCAALESRAVDGAVMGRIVSSTSVKTLANFGLSPYYYVATKGNKEVVDGLNRALTHLKSDEPTYEIDLYNKYYPNGNVPGDTRLTRQEAYYLEKNPVINFSAYSNWPVVSYKNPANNDAIGIGVETAELVAKQVNLKLRQVKAPTYADSLNDIVAKRAQIALVTEESYDRSTMVCSDPVIEMPLVIVGQESMQMPAGARIAIANASQYKDLATYLPADSSLLECFDIYACFEALKNGEADVTIVDPYMLDFISKSMKYGELKVISTLDCTVSLRFATLKGTDPSLMSIINKSIAQLRESDKEAIVLRNTAQKQYQLGFSQFVASYSLLFGIIVALVVIGFAVCILFYRLGIKKKASSVAHTDTLLGIRNFEKFKLDVSELFTKFKRDDFSLIYFDVNKFKFINDNFGYKAGNDILVHVAECAIDLLYEYELFARVSSDNFVMLLKNTDENLIKQTIKKLSRSVSYHPIFNGTSHRITLCFGIYRLPTEKEDIYTSLDRANAARKTIKGSYDATYAFYNDKMLRQLVHEVELTSAMAPALANGEFKLYLQPKHSVDSAGIIGAEALVRWCPPNSKIIQPNDFIPLMEKTGFVTQIDFFIFEEVCKLLRNMINNNYTIYPISVNLSRAHMQSRDFIQKLNASIQRYNIPPNLIELELTETMILQNQKEVLAIMHTLKEIGFKLSLDDFGTGYSSLGLLMEMPVDVLKLDKSFLSEVMTTPKERTILNDIISMAHHLSMTVVSEGVETDDQLSMLSDISCDIAQGFLFSKPIPADDYLSYII